MHVMVDCETLGLSSHAYLLSIGVVQFDREGIYETFHRHIAADIGGKMDIGTVRWWLSQSKEAQEALLNGERYSLESTLRYLKDFVQGAEGVWANGPAEDLTWIKSAADRCGGDAGVEHRKQRCFRTFRELFPLDPAEFPKDSISHDALSDAIWQAQYMINACKKYNIEL